MLITNTGAGRSQQKWQQLRLDASRREWNSPSYLSPDQHLPFVPCSDTSKLSSYPP